MFFGTSTSPNISRANQGIFNVILVILLTKCARWCWLDSKINRMSKLSPLVIILIIKRFKFDCLNNYISKYGSIIVYLYNILGKIKNISLAFSKVARSKWKISFYLNIVAFVLQYICLSFFYPFSEVIKVCVSPLKPQTTP